MPHLLITTQVYPPEQHPTAIMVHEVAQHAASLGWEVTVAAGQPHHPGRRLYPGWQPRMSAAMHEGGVTVRRVWHPVFTHGGLYGKAVLLGLQAAATTVAASLATKPDLVLSYGPPLLGPVLSSFVAHRFACPLVTVIYDLYPDIALESGMLRNGMLRHLARQLEQFQYYRSDKLLVLSEGFRRTLVEVKGVPRSKVDVVPVWLDTNIVHPWPRTNPWRKEQDLEDDKTIVLYAGTIGLVSGADVVLDAASRLVEREDILFLFVGEGDLKARLENEASQRSLPNMRFLPFQPRARLAEVQSTADISLVTLAPGRGRTSVPSKVLGYMAAGRPIVASVDTDSDTAFQVKSHECGLVVPPNDAAALASSILRLVDSPDLRRHLGENGSKAFQTHYAKTAVMRRFFDSLQSVTASGRATE